MFDPSKAGAIILDELCHGSIDEALKLMQATRARLVENGKLTERNSEQLEALTEWFNAQR